ncbi:universal stress protein YxiE-like isoform X1 [Mytilus trossulus]|uniref:universal stress protein YxiE-like isoform X1 n=1 Tax=Mytilus trossulus TaxID=6551 RepID=UPI0030060A1E
MEDRKISVVLLSVDGSDVSLFAIKKYSEELMESNHHVVAVLVGERTDVAFSAIGPLDKSLVKALIEAEEQKISEKISRVKACMDECKIKGEIIRAFGEPGPAILDKAKELKASFIVTGSRGLGKLRKTLLGSVSSYLLHHAHIPIVVCKMPS